MYIKKLRYPFSVEWTHTLWKYAQTQWVKHYWKRITQTYTYMPGSINLCLGINVHKYSFNLIFHIYKHHLSFSIDTPMWLRKKIN